MSEEMTAEQVRAAALALLSEEEFQQQVIDLAHLHGWKVAHFRKVRVQRADGSVYWETPVAADGKGWTDLVLVRERVIYVEVKTDTGQLTEEQKEWRNWLAKAGAEWHLFRPRYWPEIERVLTQGGIQP